MGSWQEALGRAFREMARRTMHVVKTDKAFDFQSAQLAEAYVDGLAREAMRDGWLDDLVVLLRAKESNPKLGREDRDKAAAFRARVESIARTPAA
ncbi:MAG: hypothetical protein JO016_08470 [Actinobacteria bacterium]|nr:hypothetical protein [Actinomycetota bacterium]